MVRKKILSDCIEDIIKENLLFAERIIKTLNKYMTSISKNVYIDELDDIANTHNNTYHRTVKMEPVDVKPSTYIDSSKKINNEDAKFKIGDIVRRSKYENTFAKGHVLYCHEKLRRYVISDIQGEEIVEKFY